MTTFNRTAAISPVDATDAIGARRPSPLAAVDLSMDAANGSESAPMPLSQRVLEAYAESSVALKGDRMQVTATLENNPGSATHPEQLLEVQRRIGDYALQTSLASGLVRKGVAAVETLLRA